MQYQLQKKTLELDTIVLDLNGTLAVYDKIPVGVPALLTKLKKAGFRVVLLTGDQRGSAPAIMKRLDLEGVIVHGGAEKAAAMKLFGKRCVAIGNARIDIGMFKHAALSIVTLQSEGIHVDVLKHADIVVPSIKDALQLLLDPPALAATLKE